MKTKRLYKSESDKALCGVCGGIAEYLEIDALIIRLIVVLLCVFWGSGLLFYIIAALIIPTESKVREQEKTVNVGSYNVDGVEYQNVNTENGEPQPRIEGSKPQKSANTSKSLGIILIVVAALLILKEILPFRISNVFLFALILAVFGVYFIVRKK